MASLDASFVDGDALLESRELLRPRYRSACPKSIAVSQALRRHLPILQWLPKYTLSTLQSDIIAGVTVGLMVVPQALAYASVAGFRHNLEYGLYAAFVGPFVYIFLGSAKDVTLGPTAIMSLLISNVAGSTLSTDSNIGTAVLLSLMAGILQVLMGFLQLGFIVEFISLPVICGFTSSAAITIALQQLKSLFGLHGIRTEFMEMVEDTFSKLGQTRVWDMVMGFCCIILLVLLQKAKTWYNRPTLLGNVVWLISTARNAVVVILAGTIAYWVVQSGHTTELTLVSKIKPGLPSFGAPVVTWSEFKSLMPSAVSVALIGYLESIAIGKSFARKNGYEVDASQELIAIGSANIFSSFLNAFPTTGSFSRTAVNSQSGVKTTLGGLFTGLLVIIALVSLTSLFEYIPNASLGAVILCAVIQMIEYHIVAHIWHTNKWDLVPFTISFVGCLLYDIQYGITMAVGVSILFILYKTARPDHYRMHYDDNLQDFVPVTNNAAVTETNDVLFIYRLASNAFFQAAGSIKDSVVSLQKSTEFSRLVIDFVNVRCLDYTSCQAIVEVCETMKKRRVHVSICCGTSTVVQMLRSVGVHAEHYNSVQLAVNAARASMVNGYAEMVEPVESPAESPIAGAGGISLDPGINGDTSDAEA
eukprot:m.139068 g.139068  ORF g.139068 m.139068 type:complete len:645 (-) comp16648_c0_seq1:440-2374(-)